MYVDPPVQKHHVGTYRHEYSPIVIEAIARIYSESEDAEVRLSLVVLGRRHVEVRSEMVM